MIVYIDYQQDYFKKATDKMFATGPTGKTCCVKQPVIFWHICNPLWPVGKHLTSTQYWLLVVLRGYSSSVLDCTDSSAQHTDQHWGKYLLWRHRVSSKLDCER